LQGRTIRTAFSPYIISSRLFLSHRAIAPVFFVCGILGVCAPARIATQSNSDQSWTTSTQTLASNTNPSRTTESHTKAGNRTIDKKSVAVLNADGLYEPYFDIEKETVQENTTTTRSIARTCNPGINGEKQLTQVTEEETQHSANDNATTLRTISNPDSNGNLQIVEREVTDTKQEGSPLIGQVGAN
jgi:hypothetical protein